MYLKYSTKYFILKFSLYIMNSNTDEMKGGIK